MTDNTNKNQQNLKIGQTLLLVLDNEKVIGTLFKLKETRLRLKDVKDFTTNEFVGANCIYYTQLIRSIKIIDSGEQKNTENDNKSELNENKRENGEAEMSSLDVKMSLETIRQISNLLKQYIFINLHDHKYFKAVEAIAKQRIIGLNIENVQHGRISIMASVLSVVTEEQIYIFDLMTLNGISKELKAILTESKPMKVVHNSKFVIDYLKHSTKVDLNNVFDTMVSIKHS